MANLNNFQQESIAELLELNYGITQLFQLLVASEDFSPNYFSKDDWKGFDRVLRIQEDAQTELKNKIKAQISDFDFNEGEGTL